MSSTTPLHRFGTHFDSDQPDDPIVFDDAPVFFPRTAPGVDPSAAAPAHRGVASAIGASGSVSDAVDQAIMAPAARSAFGVDGTGIKIGIVSDSFDLLSPGSAAIDERDGALPSASNVHILRDSYNGDTTTDEGRAMAEIIHSIAPGAQIYFYSAGGSQANMATAITALQQQGCQIIVDDIIFEDEAFYQPGGVINNAIDAAVARGVTYFTAAGNDGNFFFEGRFNSILATLPVGTMGAAATVTAENFGSAGAPTPYETLTITSNTSVDVIVQWAQPFASIGGRGAASSLAVYLFQVTDTGPVLVASGTANAVGSNPVQIASYKNSSSNGNFEIAVVSNGGAPPGEFKVILSSPNSPGAAFTEANAGSGSGSIYGHVMDPNAIAVGAAPAFAPTAAEPFSSTGPGTFLFDSHGNSLATPQTANGVAVTAPDGNSTTVTDINPFFGTSAAAPAAAAVGALMLAADPALNPTDISNLLKDSATPLPSPLVTGAGLVNADSAVRMAKTLTIAEGSGQSTVLGTHLNDTFLGGPGSHAINGEGGVNTLSYAAAPAAVSVNLAAATAQNGYGGTDSFANIQAFTGSAFNDVFMAGFGSASIAGGGGHDTLVLPEASAQYTLTANAPGQIVVTTGAQTIATSAIEFLQFTDRTVFVENSGIADIAALYSAALGRSPDITGLEGWENIYSSSIPTSAKAAGAFVALAETPADGLASIAAGFVGSSEFQQKYGTLSDTAYLTQLYANILDRAPDPAGFNAWLTLLHQGDASGQIYTREMVLVGFAASPENLSNIESTWLRIV